MADVKAIAEELVNLTVKEVTELKTILKDEYGIEPAAAAVAACTLHWLWLSWHAALLASHLSSLAAAELFLHPASAALQALQPCVSVQAYHALASVSQPPPSSAAALAPSAAF